MSQTEVRELAKRERTRFSVEFKRQALLRAVKDGGRGTADAEQDGTGHPQSAAVLMQIRLFPTSKDPDSRHTGRMTSPRSQGIENSNAIFRLSVG